MNSSSTDDDANWSGYDDFLKISSPLIDDVKSHFDEVLATALESGGAWHPTGFAILDLVDFPGIGLLRLHVWPRQARVSFPGHPVVHCHCFHLHSEVLAGTYSEVRYMVSGRNSDDSTKNSMGSVEMSRFLVGPKVNVCTDDLIDDGSKMIVTRLGSRSMEMKNSRHSMPAGSFHSTAIPSSDSCVTLAFLSRPVQHARDYLLARHGRFARVKERVSITPNAMRGMVEECLDEDLI